MINVNKGFCSNKVIILKANKKCWMMTLMSGSKQKVLFDVKAKHVNVETCVLDMSTSYLQTYFAKKWLLIIFPQDHMQSVLVKWHMKWDTQTWVQVINRHNLSKKRLLINFPMTIFKAYFHHVVHIMGISDMSTSH